jgi:sRNA-binding regulator protein Hfq
MIKFEQGTIHNPLGRRARAASQKVRIILRNGMKIVGSVEIKE